MNTLLLVRTYFRKALVILLFILGILPANAALRNWTNTLGGSWFAPANWSPNGVPGSSDAVTITNVGTYTVLVPTGAVSTAIINLGGASGTQTLIYGSSSGQLFITNSAVQANGVLVVTNGGLQGALLVQPGGQLLFDTPSSLFLYNFALTNQGTVTWTNGALSVGGSNSDTTSISNGGLWQITGNYNMNYGGGSRPIMLNGGTVRKLLSTGTSVVSMDLVNLPSGLVDVSSGTLRFSAFATNILGGTFTATSPGQMIFTGNQTDAGGTASGSGSLQFSSGNFYLRTNLIPQIKFAGGDVYIVGTNTFQQAGAITNLTLEGAQLRGTNRVAGTLTVNAGNLLESLTIEPSGQLLLAAPGGSLLYSLDLMNQGTVVWSGAALAVGGTPPTVISNGGAWVITGDAGLNFGGGNTPYFTNSGTVQKTAGTGVSSLGGVSFVNQASGIVSVSTGTLQMPNNYTNTAGALRLNGGTLTTIGTLGMTGGQLDGTGTIGGDSVFDGGTISPGQGPGLLQFKSGLQLGSNATLVIDGTGTIPGTQYDQLSVRGALTINSCALQITSLPIVPIGTSFVIITNNNVGAVSGTFNGLPDNSLLTIGSQLFRIRYAGGSGNDVLLVRTSLTGPQLFSGGYANSAFRLLGAGSGSGIYTIQATTNFVQWTDLATATADPAGNFSFTDTNAAKFRYRFYRAAN